MTRPIGSTVTNAERLRTLRAEARARGDCIECRCRPRSDGCTSCRLCLDRHRDRVTEYRAQGLCRCGKPPRRGKTTCAACAKRNAASHRRDRERDVAKGICVHHGCHQPAKPGRKRCPGCLAKSAAAQRRYLQRERAATENPDSVGLAVAMDEAAP